MSNKSGRHRHLMILAIDELPVFKSSGELLTTVALPQCRKYLLRTIACAQGATVFPEKTDDRLLQSFLSLAGTRLYFRHNSEMDCAFFGRHIALPVYSPMIVKYRHIQPTQFQDGHRLVELADRSVNDSETDTEGRSQGSTITETDTWNNSATTTVNDTLGTAHDRQVFRETVNEARSHARADQAGRGGTKGTSQENSVSRSRATGRSRGATYKQQLVPIINTKDVVTSVQFFNKEELDATGATVIANLRVGQAVLHTSGSAPVRVTFPFAADPFEMCPRFAKEKEAKHRAALEQLEGFATVKEIEEQRKLPLASLLQRLAAVAEKKTDSAKLLTSQPTVPVLGSGDKPIIELLPTNDPTNTPLEI